MYEYKGTIERVIDGDTYEITLALGFYVTTRQRVRLLGVYTPETHGVKKNSPEYKAGMKAKKFVEEVFAQNDNQVKLRTHKTGKFGRWIAEIAVQYDGKLWMLHKLLLEKKLAKPYKK